MARRSIAYAMATTAAVTPSMAHARAGAADDTLDITLGVLTLLAAIVLLVASVGLERVADGSAMADNARWVMLGAICLAGHVLVLWIAGFLPAGSFAAMQARLGSDALIILGLVFFAVYFLRVRTALTRFARRARKMADEMVAQAAAEAAADASADGVAEVATLLPVSPDTED